MTVDCLAKNKSDFPKTIAEDKMSRLIALQKSESDSSRVCLIEDPDLSPK